MAGMTAESEVHARMQPIPARTQLLAVAWLRWRMFVNSAFRRRPTTAGQTAGLVFAILLRVIAWPFIALMAIGPIVGSGFLAWAAIAEHREQNLLPLLAGITLLWQFVSINGVSISVSTLRFDPSSLIRFPLRFGRYLILRTALGLLTPSTIVGCLALMAAAAGIGIAKPALALAAVMVLAAYALMNIFLTRMIEVWMERWLANRRFREIFGMLMALFAVSVQFLNFQHAPLHGHSAAHSWMLDSLHGSESYLNWLPPGFAANAILLTARPLTALAQFAALLASTALLAAVFALRLHKQFLGEYLSEGAIPGRKTDSAMLAKARRERHEARQTSAAPQTASPGFPPIVGTCLRKEWLSFRGNGSQLIGLLTPLVFVVILNRTVFARHPAYFLPGAIAYVLVGVLAGLYNIFGADGLGVQIYLLAPVRMRDVIVAKNLASLVLIVAEAGLAWILVSMLSHAPIPLATQIATGLWTCFVIATNLALGTLRSIQAPHKYIPGQTRQRRGTPTNRTSSLLILVVLFGSMLLQIPVVLLCSYLDQPWLAAFIFAPLALVAVLAYALLLRNAEKLVMNHRDTLIEELCKA
ncbi:MAG: hypothetical protein WBC92_13595 [Terracidiphilus sp.]